MLNNFFTLSRFTLFVALCISAIAAYYSVVGLTAIFAGAVIPIIVMGGILEIAKITTTVWLHKYWNRAGWGIKAYLTAAVIALACLTSMGIFGLLSKAHSDTGLVSGDVAARVVLIDEKIKTQRDNIDAARKALQQMDEQVNQRLSRSGSEQGAERAVQIRRQQAAERNKLQKEIGDAQTIISKLNEERAPIAASQRKVEAEVGPIKYIASLIYGDNPDTNLLERAVRWVIIMIVIVFDPLAIILILAANNSLRWENEDKGKVKEVQTIVQSEPEPEPKLEPEPEPKLEPEIETQNQVISDNQKILEAIHEEIKELNPVLQEEPVTKPNFGQGNYSTNYTIMTPNINLKSDAIESEIEKPITKLNESNEIATEGVTVELPTEEYVMYEGKKTSFAALKEIRPDIVDSLLKNDIIYGSQFPKIAKVGDIYIRTDIIPHCVFKFNGHKWLELDKKINVSYLQSVSYIQYLISKLDSGEYDPELLTPLEEEEISVYLKNSI